MNTMTIHNHDAMLLDGSESDDTATSAREFLYDHAATSKTIADCVEYTMGTDTLLEKYSEWLCSISDDEAIRLATELAEKI